jgi:hypothetical protein
VKGLAACLLAIAVSAVASLSGTAQPPAKMFRIGILSPAASPSTKASFAVTHHRHSDSPAHSIMFARATEPRPSAQSKTPPHHHRGHSIPIARAAVPRFSPICF